MTLLDQAMRVVERCNRQRLFGLLFDVPSKFEYFLVHPTGKVWAAYCTYFRYDWDKAHQYPNHELIFLVSGHPEKPRIILGSVGNRLRGYRDRKRRDGFTPFSGNIREQYPEICAKLDQVLTWVELKR